MSEIDFLAVHGLAVRKAAAPPAVASLLGVDVDQITASLERATEAGRVVGARGTFMVTPAGQAWLAERYPEVYAAARESPALASAYTRFERVNRELLALMTDWQTVPAADSRIPNDHTDADYDAKIIDRLGALHERSERVIGLSIAEVPRLGCHLRRLSEAYERVLAGESNYVSGVQVDSYHTVWFELHEDLLRVLGKSREE